MSSISLKNCELAQIILLCTFYVFLKTHALAVQFSMIDSLVPVLADSLYIIPHSFSFVKGFFESFLIFFKVFSKALVCQALYAVFWCLSQGARILYHKPSVLSRGFLKVF